MSADELKPCPCCGGRARFSMRQRGRSKIGTPWCREVVSCARECVSTKVHKTPGKAAAAWNRRGKADEPEARAEDSHV